MPHRFSAWITGIQVPVQLLRCMHPRHYAGLAEGPGQPFGGALLMMESYVIIYKLQKVCDV